MQRDTDSTDIPTVRHGLKLEIPPTSVGRLLTVSVKCRSTVMRSVGRVSVRRAKQSKREVSVKRRKRFYFEFRADGGYSSNAVTLLRG